MQKFRCYLKIFLFIFLLMVNNSVFSSVTIEGYLYNMDSKSQVRFITPYPNNVKSSSIVPYEQLDSIIVNTKNLMPHTTLFTISDDMGNSCDVGVTSVHMNTQFEIIHSTSKEFCIIAPAPNFVINIGEGLR